MMGAGSEKDGLDVIAEAQRPALHIGLLWHSIFNGNLGVGALSIANGQLAAKAAEKCGFRPVLHIIGSRGVFDYGSDLGYEYDFTNIGIKALANPFSDLNKTLRRCDIFFDIGGGDSFSDIYSGSAFRKSILSKLAAIITGRPLIFSPQTIGPFYAAWAKTSAKVVLKAAKHVFARDDRSFEVLKEMGVQRSSTLATDVAFALRFEPPARKAAGTPMKVGLNVSSLLYRLDEFPDTRVKLALDYRAFVHDLIEWLVEERSVELHLVPHVIDATNLAGERPANAEDDYAIARQLRQRFPSIILPECFYSPIEAKNYIASLDLFAGSRMHSTIAAISSDTGVIPLGYSRKFDGLFGTIGYERTIDLTVESNADALRKFKALFANAPELEAEAIAANRKAKTALSAYTTFLEATFTELAATYAGR